MLQTRPFSHDPDTGAVTKWWHYDDVTDEAIIEDVIDFDAYGRANAIRKGELDGTRFKHDFNWIGQIPAPVYWRLKKAGIMDDESRLKKWWLTDEAAPFRGRTMRL